MGIIMIQPVDAPIISPFGSRKNPFTGKWDYHYGVDYKTPKGTPVVASGDGEVIRASSHPEYGNVIVIYHGIDDQGRYVYTLYAHLEENGFTVKVGDQVTKGELIGFSGGVPGEPGSGSSTGEHLHFGIIRADHLLPWNKTGSMGVPGREDPREDDPKKGVYYMNPEDFIREHSNLFKTAISSVDPVPRGCPLILDLDGDGVETVCVNDSAYFDHDGNGFAESTGWVESDDGLLVMDRNGDGIINDGKELFGDQTILKSGIRASNGFQALADLDDNKDGKIDINDTALSNLRVWRDLNVDGTSSSDELFTLSELGIKAINTNYTNTNITDSHNNIQASIGSFTKSDGTTGQIGDYLLQRDTIYSIPKEILVLEKRCQVLTLDIRYQL